MPRRRKCWTHSVGVYGSRVRVAEREPGGMLHLLWLDKQRRQHKRALGHSDRKRGKEEALALANQLADDRQSVESAKLTVARLFDIYVTHGLHGRTDRHRQEVQRKLDLWLTFLGPDREIESLSPADVERFVDLRRTGKLRPPHSKKGSSVSGTTIWHDYVALVTALNFAERHRDGRGKPILLANPLRGVRVAKTVTPTRPVADDAFYDALRSIASHCSAQFSLALDLAFATGHRIDAILKLRWSDVNFTASDNAPFGCIRWRGENDKIENEHTTPMNEVAHAALLQVARERQAIGEAWVFPSATDDSRPVDRHLANRWLRRAEKLAEIEHIQGRGWHSFRRGWASARRHLPDVDVATAGGWKDTTTMRRCYMHSDAASVLRVVTEPVRRVSG